MKNVLDKTKYPNCHSGFQYALDVIAGKIPNSKYIIGACERFLKDFGGSLNPENPYVFDIDYVERYLKVVQLLEHVIGEWETPNIIYNPWQKWVWMAALGFKHKVNRKWPKYRTIHLEVPRGASKSTMASQCALFFIGLEPNRNGEKIACFATKSDQARIILDAARAMASKSTKYLKASGVKVLAHKIVHGLTNSEMVAMSADSKGMDGLNLRIAFCDELHQMTRELFEVIVSGQKKRRDSLTICCTTAGFNNDGIGYSQSQYAKKIALGEVKDESFFSAVYTIDDGDDIHDPLSWAKANPNHGFSVDPIAVQSASDKAKVTPSDLPNFMVKTLNIWLAQAFAYFDINKFDACYDPQMKLEDFQNKPCYGAVDLASKLDLTCHGNLFRKDGHYYFFFDAFLPQATKDEAKSSIIYDEAVAEGSLIITPGEAINQETIENHYIRKSKNFRLKETMYDPWNAVNFAASLSKQGFEMVEFKQNTANYSEAMKTLAALIAEKKFHHNGSKLLRYCIGNVVSKEDANGNHFPRKTSDKLKIDIAVTLLMCLAAWLNEKQEESVYHERGIRRL